MLQAGSVAAAAAGGQNAALRRSVGFWGLAAMVLNGVVGAGIFAMPGAVANVVGGWAPIVVAAVGIGMLPIVLVFARLATLFDAAGGPLLYVHEAYGCEAAFQIGWMQNLSVIAASAANANLLADYLARAAPEGVVGPAIHAALVVAAISLAFAVNLADAKGSAAWLMRLSVAKLVPLTLLIGLALPHAGEPIVAAQTWSLTQGIILSVYAFTGFEGAVSMAGEARNPRRDLPRALIGVFFVIVALYTLLTLGYVVTSYTGGAADKAALATMATRLLGPMGVILVVLTAAVSIFGNVSNSLLAVSRRLVGLEQIGTLPRWFGRVRADSGLPRNAVLITVATAMALAVSGGFVVLATISVASRLVVYGGSIASLPVIEYRRGLQRSLSGVIIVALAGASVLFLIAQTELATWQALAIVILVGAVTRAAAWRGSAMGAAAGG